jgi:hypothetical protein
MGDDNLACQDRMIVGDVCIIKPRAVFKLYL